MSTSSKGAEGSAGRVELRVRVTSEQAWPLSDALETAGALSVTLEPLEDSVPQLEPEPGTTPLWSELELSALFPGRTEGVAAMEHLRSMGLEPAVTGCPDRDWLALGRSGLAPRLVADKLWIVPDWCDPPDSPLPAVRIAPGLAFGTGSHPTTSLCLEWLAGSDLRGKRVIDYGAGSGILALAAARLGAGSVVAVDNEPQALVAARANAGLNDLNISAVAPEGLAHGIEADIVVANILARPLVALAPVLLGHLLPGGYLVLSGITTEQADVVAAAYTPAARQVSRHCRDEWVCLVMSKT